MGIPNDDEVKGAFNRAKGKVKETIGVATDNERLEGEGKADQIKGSVRQTFGEGRRKVGEVIEDVGNAIKR